MNSYCDWTVYADKREGGSVRCFYCHEPVGGRHKDDCVVCCDCEVQVTLRRVSDGSTRVVLDPWNSRLSPEFWWTDGNGGCDCNRELYFCRAAGEDEPEEPECGDTRFELLSIRRVMKEQGR